MDLSGISRIDCILGLHEDGIVEWPERVRAAHAVRSRATTQLLSLCRLDKSSQVCTQLSIPSCMILVTSLINSVN